MVYSYLNDNYYDYLRMLADWYQDGTLYSDFFNVQMGSTDKWFASGQCPVNTGTAAPEALPAAKHIFSHIEWHMNGILLHVPAQDAPAGCVWASREALQAEYTLPGAFKAYRKLIV